MYVDGYTATKLEYEQGKSYMLATSLGTVSYVMITIING